jgi:hypothetical protein
MWLDDLDEETDPAAADTGEAAARRDVLGEARRGTSRRKHRRSHHGRPGSRRPFGLGRIRRRSGRGPCAAQRERGRLRPHLRRPPGGRAPPRGRAHRPVVAILTPPLRGSPLAAHRRPGRHPGLSAGNRVRELERSERASAVTVGGGLACCRVGNPLTTTGQGASISIWDVTVRDTGGVVQPGRLFSNRLAFNEPSSIAPTLGPNRRAGPSLRHGRQMRPRWRAAATASARHPAPRRR